MVKSICEYALNYIKNEILNLKNNNITDMVNFLTQDVDSYLNYYAFLRLENLTDIYDAFNVNNLFLIRGCDGSGKTSFKKLLKASFEENIKIFEYSCSEITELDDIFFKFYRFMQQNPLKRDIFRAKNQIFSPPSIDEQIMNYIKNASNLVIILDNFEKLTDETGDIKTDNIKNFIELLTALKHSKLIIFSTINVKSIIDVDFSSTFDLRIEPLTQTQFYDFISIFKLEIPQTIQNIVYEKTKGYIHSLKFLILATKILNLPISNIIKESSNHTQELNEFIAKKIIIKLSDETKKALFYFALFRHEINAKILQNIDNFKNAQKEIDLLKSYMLLDGNINYEVRDFIKNTIKPIISDRDKLKYHEKITEFYSGQIPLKPNDRVIDISRTSMYSEKFYHSNIVTKLTKNFELQSEKFKSSKIQDDKIQNSNKINSETIKYISSSSYSASPEMKQVYKDIMEQKRSIDIMPQIIAKENNSDYIEIDDKDVVLSEEEKALLRYNQNDILNDENTPQNTTSDLEEYLRNNNITDFVDRYSELVAEEENEIQKAENLLTKGVNSLQQGEYNESITYIKNSMSYLKNKDDEKYFKAKLTLIETYIEAFKLTEAKNHLNELLNEEINPTTKANALIDLGYIAETEKDINFAFQCYYDALEIALTNELNLCSSNVLFKIALLEDELNNYDSAIEKYLEAAKYAEIAKEYSTMASAYSNIASINEENNNFQAAINYYKKSLKADILDNNFDGQTKTLSALGNIFITQNDTKLALKIFIKETQTAKQSKDSYLIAASYLELGDTFLNIRNYKNALKAYILARKNIDNTISTDSKNKIECRFDMLIDEIGENAYKFLLKELKENGQKNK